MYTIIRILALAIFLFPALLFADVNKPSQADAEDGSTLVPGFAKGSFYFTMWLGGYLAPPGGSFIRHEKLYDETRNNEILLGQLDYVEPFGSWVAVPAKNSYSSGGIYGFSLEYAVSNFLGAGVSFFNTNVWAERLNVKRDPRDGKLYILPMETDNDFQLGLTSVSMDINVHPFHDKSIDPYLAVHGGPAFPHGKAHQGYTLDIYKSNEGIHNGLGFVYGASLGCNFYFDPRGAVRAEVSHYRYDFHADEFSNRTYYNTFLTVGFVFRGNEN